ncbi:coiled-coil domain-containing protein [Legionella hackeliae]|uniref:Ankyrin repeat protein n=1 Tax=Legionella hackeliae TaxID=449 RepID=A0A0A8UPH3_LEGHA|nr:hypothetical protein [Legionella hackeliae]KTD13909.1 effector protein B, substrate of the Dot/Icm secretion system [Legionella hackeliae]CEK10613.1 conserved protein of unknown function [7 coiled-coil domains] [Legionella hackeliae]STX47355.1 LepB protein [Legionella hackeliae]
MPTFWAMMGEVMGRRVKQKNYTTFEESALKKILSHFKPLILELHTTLTQKDSQIPESSCETFTRNQFEAFKQAIALFEEAGPLFSKGSQPNLLTLAIKHGSKVSQIGNIKKALSSPRYAIYHLWKEEFPKLYSQIQHEKASNKGEHFRQKLKDEIERKLPELNAAIPGGNFESYFKEIENFIEQYTITSKGLAKRVFDNDKEIILQEGLRPENIVSDFRVSILGDNLTLEFRVVHPASYELAVEIFLLCEQFPREFEDLVSFLNPSALDNLKISHKKDSGGRDYIYDIGNGPIDTEQFYNESVNLLPSILSSRLASYFKTYADTLHVKSERAKMQLVSQFIKAENEFLKGKVDSTLLSLSELDSTKDILEKDALPRLKEISILEHKERRLLALIEELKERNYKSLPFGTLLESHPSLLSQCKKESNLTNANYLKKPLKEKLLIEGDRLFNILEVQDNLAKNMETQQSIILENLQQLKQTKEALIQQHHLDRNNNIEQVIEEIKKDCDGIDELIMSVEELHSAELLRGQLEKLKFVQQKLSVSENTLDALQSEFSQLDLAEEKIKSLYRGNQERAVAVANSVKHAQYRVADAIQKASSGLEVAIFAEKMQAANPQERQLLLKAKEASLEEKRKDQSKIEEVLALLEKTRREQRSVNSSGESLLDLDKRKHFDSIVEIQKKIAEQKDLLLKFRPMKSEEFDTMFSEHQLKSDPAIIDLWIKSVIFNEDKLVEKESIFASKIDECLVKHNALTAAHKVLDTKKFFNKSYVEQIEKLKELESLKEKYGSLSAMGVLFLLLGEVSVVESQKQFTCEPQVLIPQIKRQLISTTQELNAFSEIQKNIGVFKECKTQLIQLSQSVTQIVTVRSALEQRAQEEHELDKKIEAEKNKLQDIKTLETEIDVLYRINALFDDNKKLNDFLTSDAQALDSKSAEGEERLGVLSDNLSELKELVLSLSQNDIYLATVAIISSLLKRNIQQVAQIKAQIVTKKIDAIFQPSTSSEPIAHELLLLCQQFKQLILLKDSVPANLQKLKSLFVANGDKEHENLEVESLLIRTFTEKEARFLDKVNALLSSYKAEIINHTEKLKLTKKEQADHSNPQHLLSEAAEYIAHNKITDLSVVRKELEMLRSEPVLCTLAQVEHEIQSFEKQFKESQIQWFRYELANKFRDECINYIKKRAEKYHLKDSFNSDDALNREQFLEEIARRLTESTSSGNYQPVLDYISSERGKFFGVTMLPIINRLLVDIKAFHKTTNPAYTEVDNIHQKALSVLTNAQGEFKKSITTVYFQIEQLEAHGNKIGGHDGDIATKLAAQLRENVDLFVIRHGEEKLDEMAFKEFKDDFTELLHSQDDTMSRHRSFWKPFLLNILAAVFTAGIAVGVKLIGSKLLTGHASFFGEPKRFKHLGNLDEALSKVTAPAA